MCVCVCVCVCAVLLHECMLMRAGCMHASKAEVGGSISAEHGVGQLKRPYLPLNRSELELDLMRQIKVGWWLVGWLVGWLAQSMHVVMLFQGGFQGWLAGWFAGSFVRSAWTGNERTLNSSRASVVLSVRWRQNQTRCYKLVSAECTYTGAACVVVRPTRGCVRFVCSVTSYACCCCAGDDGPGGDS